MSFIGVFIALFGSGAFADDDSSPTMNVCISPQACFKNVGDDSVSYCITSPWSITYPSTLRSHLSHVPSIAPFDWNADSTFDRCGWNQGYDEVTRQSVNRGTVYYKANNASLDFRPPTFPQDTAAVIHVMKNTYPITEIMLIVLFCVILPVGLPLAICCWAPVGRGFRGMRERIRKSREVRVRNATAKRLAKEGEKAAKKSDKTSPGGSSDSGSGWDEKSPV